MIGKIAASVSLVFAVTSSAFCMTSLAPLSDESIERLLTGYLQTWSANDKFDRGNMARFYADQVTYYGKYMSREQVLRDKQRYIAVWPERQYSLVPGSHTVACDSKRSACLVTGTMRWDRRSVSGVRSVGQARIKILVSAGSGGRIVRESATIQRFASQ